MSILQILVLVIGTLIIYKLVYQPTDNQLPQKPQLISYMDKYNHYKVYYEAFGDIVHLGLLTICVKCKIKVPSNVVEIYCPDVADRVTEDIATSTCTFCYEVSLEEPLYGGGMKKMPGIPNEEIERLAADNIRSNLRGGYSFNGPVHVWNIGNNRIRIEINGVYRNMGDIEI